MPKTDLEEIRRRNIERNKDLLKKLNLNAIKESLSLKGKVKEKASSKTSRVSKSASAIPTRRSRRLASTPEEKEEDRLKEIEEEKNRSKQEKLRQLRLTKLIGEFNLFDLLTEKGLGQLKNESKVLSIDDSQSVSTHMAPDSVISAEESSALEKLRGMSQRFSAGDFYPVIRAKLNENDKSVDSKRKEFDSLKFYDRFDPVKIKLTHQRITSLHFHPSVEDRLISAGDTNGSLGIWAVDSSANDDEPLITIFKPHGRAVSRICEVPKTPAQLVSVSYDGSARILDIKKQNSHECFSLTDADGSLLGISDLRIHHSAPHTLLVTTLQGHFYRHDLRSPPTPVLYKQLLRLHDKKVGGFSVNPNREYQILSASLDRSFKLWDLRAISKNNNVSEIADLLSSPHLYGSFTSRLSVSNVDWNSSNRLVCNGYDDHINIIDLSGERKNYSDINKWTKTFVPKLKTRGKESEVSNNIVSFASIRHNCQTGRWVSILKARWQCSPLDYFEKFLIANMNRSFDIYSQEGKILASLTSPEMTAVPAVALMHPTENWVAGGTSSGKVYLFK